MTMSSSRPYLLRALYEWILDNGNTPYILVDAGSGSVNVPEEHVKDGKIILNISPSAVRDLDIGNQSLEFNGRFAGIAKPVYLSLLNPCWVFMLGKMGRVCFLMSRTQRRNHPTTEVRQNRTEQIRHRPTLRVVK